MDNHPHQLEMSRCLDALVDRKLQHPMNRDDLFLKLPQYVLFHKKLL